MQPVINNDIYVNGQMIQFDASQKIQQETEKAILVQVYSGTTPYNKPVWIPKSIVKIDNDKMEMHLPEWFVNKNILSINFS
jgi:hypothetical protein